jgi:opacity protein-like surface antigen
MNSPLCHLSSDDEPYASEAAFKHPFHFHHQTTNNCIPMKTRFRSLVFGLITLTFAAASADAQMPQSVRAGHSEFYILAQDWSSESVTLSDLTLPTQPGPNPIPVTSDLRFNYENTFFWGFGGGYNVSEALMVRGELTFGNPDYEMTWNNARITGESWVHQGKVNLDWNILQRRSISPFISGGIGYMYVDTGIPSGPPQYSVWWDYFWGPVVVGTQPTHQETFFTYNAAAGFRWDIADRSAMRVSYASNWIDAKRGTQRTNELTFSFSWKY